MWNEPLLSVDDNRAAHAHTPTGLHKGIILIIRDNGKSHSLEITYKKPQKKYFRQNMFLSQKKSYFERKLSVTKTYVRHRKRVNVTETSFCKTKIYTSKKCFSENRCPSQKQGSVRVSVREKHFYLRKLSFCHIFFSSATDKSFSQRKKASVTEAR